ncbi:hypothetical protein [Streptomyces sp. MNP-20]|uniref:hypothetical protein n=1 Tax=Streptomyces sp. MNP-20 TaxID=2721165 RepID=UPI0015551DD2|nr:hypothetical protein [Streptomyces sp. MNP-20]
MNTPAAPPPHPHHAHNNADPHTTYSTPQPRAAFPWPPRTVQPYCRFCGAQPTADVTIRAHQGLLVIMRFQSEAGPWCRVCGIALVRHLTTRTLWQGWWSPFSLALLTPFTLISNLAAYRRLTALEPPGPVAPGAARPLEGAPVLKRPLAYVALVPLIWAVWFITGLITHT